MKLRLFIIITLSLLLSACFKHGAIHDQGEPVNIQLDKSLNLRFDDGILVAYDEHGKIISKRVKLPLELNSESTKKTLYSVQEFTILTIKGSCDAYIKFGSQYIHVRLPDGHPYCN